MLNSNKSKSCTVPVNYLYRPYYDDTSHCISIQLHPRDGCSVHDVMQAIHVREADSGSDLLPVISERCIVGYVYGYIYDVNSLLLKITLSNQFIIKFLTEGIAAVAYPHVAESGDVDGVCIDIESEVSA